MNDTLLKSLRLATNADIEELEKLVQLAYRGGLSKVAWKNEHDLVDGPRITVDELKQELTDKSNHILVLENEKGKESNFIGCVKVVRDSDTQAHVGMLTVHPDMQDQGLGRKLLAAAEQYAKEKLHSRTVQMTVLSGRPDLLNWYKRQGYEETGETEPFFGPESGQQPTAADAHFLVISKNI